MTADQTILLKAFEEKYGEVTFYYGNRQVEMYRTGDEMTASNMIICYKTTAEMMAFIQGCIAEWYVAQQFSRDSSKQ